MSEWSRDVLEELRAEGLNRIKGGVLRRIFRGGGGRSPLPMHAGRGQLVPSHASDRGLRFSRASYFTGISEAADKMNEAERAAFRASRAVPDWFWDEVERSAASWDALPD